MFEVAETLQQIAWLAVAGGLILLALGSVYMLLVYAGLFSRTARGWRHWAARRSLTAALVFLLAAALAQVVAHRGLADRPDASSEAAAPSEAATPAEAAAVPQADESRAASARPAVSAAAAQAAFDEALAAREEGLADAAAHAYRRAREAFAALGDARREADAMHGLGDMALAGGDAAGAERHYLGAQSLFARLANDIGEANTLVGLAGVKTAGGRRAEAERLLEDAHAIYFKAASAHGRANVALARASLAADPARARRLYRDAAGLYLRAGLPGWADYARNRAR